MFGTLRLDVRIAGAVAGSRDLAPEAAPAGLGRDPSNPLQVDAEPVAARQARIQTGDRGWEWVELSGRSTDWNGMPLRAGQKVPLAEGDLIRIGEVELSVSLLAAPAAQAPPEPARPATALAQLLGGLEAPPLGPRVQYFLGGEFQAEFPLEEEGAGIVIGRDKECGIQVPDPFRVISRQHAKVYRSWGGSFLRVWGQHGVWVNAEKFGENQPIALKHHDRISFTPEGAAGAVLIYLEGGEPGPAPPEIVSPAPAPAPAPAPGNAPAHPAGPAGTFEGVLDATPGEAPAEPSLLRQLAPLLAGGLLCLLAIVAGLVGSGC